MDWNGRSAYLMVKTEPGWTEKVWKKTQTWPDAIGSWVVTGDWDLMVWIDAFSWEEVYRWVKQLRAEKGVKASSSHWVYWGSKNGSWWWDWKAGSWVLWRGSRLNGKPSGVNGWKWAVSTASIPGDWDYLTWVGAKDWPEVWGHVLQMNQKGWETKTLVPVRSWWNKSWKNKWW